MDRHKKNCDWELVRNEIGSLVKNAFGSLSKNERHKNSQILKLELKIAESLGFFKFDGLKRV